MLCGSAIGGMPGNGAEPRLLVRWWCPDRAGDVDGEADGAAIATDGEADAAGLVSSDFAASSSAHAASAPRPTIVVTASTARCRLSGGVGTHPTLEQALPPAAAA